MLQYYCTSLKSTLTVENKPDINANDLQELQGVSQMLPFFMKPLEEWNYSYLSKYNLITLYPNVCCNSKSVIKRFFKFKTD